MSLSFTRRTLPTRVIVRFIQTRRKTNPYEANREGESEEGKNSRRDERRIISTRCRGGGGGGKKEKKGKRKKKREIAIERFDYRRISIIGRSVRLPR